MEGKAFDWKEYLDKGQVIAASVFSFKHVPGAKLWNDSVVVGIKLVTRHQDALPRRRSLAARPSFWIVTVLETQGYFARVRYLGMKEDDKHDFWMHLGQHEIYPVGGQRDTALFMPPQFLAEKSEDWRNDFVSELSGARTLPSGFLPQFTESCDFRNYKYKVGDLLEVVNNSNMSYYRLGRVTRNIGRRLYLRYLDGDDKKGDGFFCHELSHLIHSLGWASVTGHTLKAPADNQIPTENNAHIVSPEVCNILQGMKFEAVDPFNPSRICAATISKVLRFGYFMAKLDCPDDYRQKLNLETNNNDTVATKAEGSFCLDVKSHTIFKCGFCTSHGIPLVPPADHDRRSAFDWNKYLKKHNSLEAPIQDKPEIEHGFQAGMSVEMADVTNPAKIYPATIVGVVGRLLRIRFDGDQPNDCQWVDAESPDIYPIGWCELAGHALQEPAQLPVDNTPTKTRTLRNGKKV